MAKHQLITASTTALWASLSRSRAKPKWLATTQKAATAPRPAMSPRALSSLQCLHELDGVAVLFPSIIQMVAVVNVCAIHFIRQAAKARP
jgi:hypothetical protein